MSDPPLEICDSCGQPALRKLVSAAGFRLKGTGWYVTDFRDKGKAKPVNEKSKTDRGKEAQPEKKKEETASSKSGTSADSASSKTGTG